jgi:hypothetical protein
MIRAMIMSLDDPDFRQTMTFEPKLLWSDPINMKVAAAVRAWVLSQSVIQTEISSINDVDAAIYLMYHSAGICGPSGCRAAVGNGCVNKKRQRRSLKSSTPAN